MSTESQVNRVHNTFVRDELKKIDSPIDAVVHKAAVDLNYDANGAPVEDPALGQQPEALDTAWDNLNEPVVKDETGITGMRSGGVEDMLSSLRALVGGEDQKVFRQQVIRAFKHIGVDTVKFFGE